MRDENLVLALWQVVVRVEHFTTVYVVRAVDAVDAVIIATHRLCAGGYNPASMRLVSVPVVVADDVMDGCEF